MNTYMCVRARAFFLSQRGSDALTRINYDKSPRQVGVAFKNASLVLADKYVPMSLHHLVETSNLPSNNNNVIMITM